METIDNNITNDNSLMVMRGLVIDVIGEKVKDGFVLSFVLFIFGSNPNKPPAELATFGAVSFGTSQNFANRFGSCQSDSSLERRHWLVGWVGASFFVCVSWLAVVGGAGGSGLG